MMMILFLLDLRLLSPWLSWSDLGRLERVSQSHYQSIGTVWQHELRRLMNAEEDRIQVPTVRGGDLLHAYIGSRQQWQGIGSKFPLAPSTSRPRTFWQRFFPWYSPAPPTPCFYRTSLDRVERWEDVYYFEMKLTHLPPGCLSVGLASSPLLLQTTGWMVGWTHDSIGVHTDEKVIRQDNKIVHRLASLEPGDVVGTGWQKYLGLWMVYFTLNGKRIFRKPFPFPNPSAVVLHDPEADFEYETNFGTKPFKEETR
jgi:hypothetical protein